MGAFIDELNEKQREAVLYTDGPSLVIAGAGSGKTRVLTYKVAYLLECGCAPYSIMALTFTNKAAREMKERVAQLVSPEQAARLWMGTFHAVFSRILRKEAEYLGFDSHFTIYDVSDTRSLLRNIVRELELDSKRYKDTLLYSRISQAKNALISPEDYALHRELQEWDQKDGLPRIKEIYKIYATRCKAARAMDFDDLLYYTNLLFRDYPEVREKYQSFFTYLLVDEYQDTNFAQYQIVKYLVEKHRRFCIVGDDAQSIYSFRGANIENILSFKKDYPNGKIFKLEQNYRSTQTIVKAANSLIGNNKYQIKKTTFSMNEKGSKLDLINAYSDLEEAMLVANKLAGLRLGKGYSYGDFAILYRTNAQSRVFEEEFRKRGIPYIVYGGLSFYQRKEIKDLLAYFRLIVNPQDEEAFRRIINYPPRGIGDTTLEKIKCCAQEHLISLWDVVTDPDRYGLEVNKGTKKKLENFYLLLSELIDLQTTTDVHALAKQVLTQSGMRALMAADISSEGEDRLNNINELLNAMNDFVEAHRESDEEVSLSAYLSEIALLTDQDTSDNAVSDCVTLMTAHASKGLEFPNVFVTGLEEDLFPSSMAKDSIHAIEEERRLLYVAITRAIDNCMLSFARSRFRNGSVEIGRPSRFLKEIDPACIALSADDMGVFSRSEAVSGRLKRVQAPIAHGKSSRPAVSKQYNASYALSVGDRIEHERFGIGEIVALEGEAENSKAKVCFVNAGEKQLLLKFARFKKIN